MLYVHGRNTMLQSRTNCRKINYFYHCRKNKYLSRHDFGVFSRYIDPGVQARAIMCLDDVTSVHLIGTDSAVVRSLQYAKNIFFIKRSQFSRIFSSFYNISPLERTHNDTISVSSLSVSRMFNRHFRTIFGLKS